MISGLSDGLVYSLLSAIASFIASYSAVKMKLSYMERDVKRAQDTADRANRRVDAVMWGGHERRHGDADENGERA